MAKTQLTNAELWRCMVEAEQRKADSALTIDQRVQSFQTYALCLREAQNRGYDYASLRAAVGRFSRLSDALSFAEAA